MDRDTFFREATLRICGNLEIEKALFDLLQYLKDFMPASMLFLQNFEPDYNSIRTFAQADLEGYRKLNLLTPISKPSVEIAKSTPSDQDIWLIKNTSEFSITRDMYKLYKIKTSSLILLMLRSEGKNLGTLVLATTGSQRFTEEHLGWVLLLKDPLIIAMSNTLKHREVLQLKNLLAEDIRFLRGELRRISGEEIIGLNLGLREVMDQVKQVAGIESPVLLLGETGVGKDVVANAIHDSSPRCNGPFITVNCGAIPDSLIDSELFGHEKGAFTGAVSQKRGRFERAEHGTIFLDEIGELPLQAQVRLLRVIQDRTLERVGGTETISLDIRIIAATNRDLERMVADKEFREDLWFRLNVFPITIPPLRSRKEDIPELVQHFIEVKSKELSLPKIPTLKENSIERLSSYEWPGNVRELQNIIERELILNPSGPLSFSSFQPKEERYEDQPDSLIAGDSSPTLNLNEIIIAHIEKVLKKTKGKIHGKHGAAELLGINASTLINRMKKLGIKYKKSEIYG